MSWEEFARCRHHDPEMFFASGVRSERKAKAVCDRCPVRDACLAFAVDSRTEFGIWGGMNGKERRRFLDGPALARRPDARPLEPAIASV